MAISFSSIADAKPGGGHGGGGRGGGGPHAGAGPRGGGGAHFGSGRGGMHVAVPHGGPRFGGRHASPRGLQSFSRAHSASPSRYSRSTFRGHARIARQAARGSSATRSSRRFVLDQRSLRRGIGQTQLRSARVHARGDFRRTNATVLGAFSGRNARTLAGRAFRDRGLLASHRFDPALLRRVGLAGAFWPGPYFWPYAYYDETFWLWASAYDEVFWTYGYDDILSGIYQPYAFSDSGDFIASIRRPSGRRHASLSASGDFAELCGAAAPGLTEWPVDEIANAIEPTREQRMLLDDLIRASDKAAEMLRAACPRSLPVTPIGRLDVMERQLAALEQAVQAVQPALEKFYGSLSDDQRERFNALSPKSEQSRRRAHGEIVPQTDRLTRACQSSASGAAVWPIDRIEQAVRPEGAQRAALSTLQSKTVDAGKVLQSTCPTDQSFTPGGRLSAMKQRIVAMRQAVETLRPALAAFYASLSDEQKARLNRALAGNDRGDG
jgi:hypothetical protein